MHFVTKITAIATVFIVGCSSPTSTAPSEETPAVADESSAFTITEVRIGADGKEEKTVYPMTKAKSMDRAERLTRPEVGGVHTENFNAGRVPCSNSSVHLYDATLVTCRYAGCNEICFEVTDPTVPISSNVYLGNYCVTAACTYSWNSMVRSYWTGDRSAFLWRNYPGYPQCSEIFGSRWSYQDAAWCGQNSDYLNFLRP